MNFLLKTLGKRLPFPKKLFFASRCYSSTNGINNEANVEIVDPEQSDEEALKKKNHSSYVFIERCLALPSEFPLFPYSKFSVNLGEMRSKVKNLNFLVFLNNFQAFNQNVSLLSYSNCSKRRI